MTGAAPAPSLHYVAHPPSAAPRWLTREAGKKGLIGMSERLTLPVFPLREVVLFPGVTTSLGAGRPGTVRAVEAALATPGRLVFAICQRENVEQVTSDGL